MIQPANRYQTRAGRRTALVLYGTFVFPAVLILGAVKGAAEELSEVIGLWNETWQK